MAVKGERRLNKGYEKMENVWHLPVILPSIPGIRGLKPSAT